jgi:curved DNA-binding protein CbpA
MSGDLFRVLGLDRRADLTDEDVRAAWRRVAAATHPDRADGGDPAQFAEAAAAYTVLRTPSGRGEALADLLGPSSSAAAPDTATGTSSVLVRTWRQLRGGRPGRLVLRLTVIAAVAAVSVLAVGWRPASFAVIAGALTWLARTGRNDLADRG